MGAERTDKSPYQSLYSPGTWITGGQWLAEKMCERRARKEKTGLPARFWELPQWKRTFAQQARLAAKLLQEFSVAAVLAALKAPDGKLVYSFGAGWFADVVRAEQARLARAGGAVEAPEPEIDGPVAVPPLSPAPPVRPQGPLSKLAKLRNLE
jgi:hypothetical protein